MLRGLCDQVVELSIDEMRIANLQTNGSVGEGSVSLVDHNDVRRLPSGFRVEGNVHWDSRLDDPNFYELSAEIDSHGGQLSVHRHEQSVEQTENQHTNTT